VSNKIISHIVSNNQYKQLCKKLCGAHADDVYQDILITLMEMSNEKVPDINYLNFWYVRVASNMCSKYGKYGRLFREDMYDRSQDVTDMNIREAVDIFMADEDYTTVEGFMLQQDEFTNRIIHLYNKTGSMLQVSKMTGISYSALRKIKELLKHESITNNTKHGEAIRC
jgi:hypothetical protein